MHPRKRHGLIWILSLTLSILAGCSREDIPPTAPVPPVSELPIADGGSEPLDDFRDSLPREGGPAGYVGSAPCRDCHPDQFASWHRTYHRTMTQFATPDTVQANFNNVTLTNQGTRFHLTKEDDELRVRMERILDSGPADEPPPALDTRVSLVTGSHHMQVFWVPGGAGNTQVGFPFTWLIPEQRWVPRTTTFLRPPNTQHVSELWNVTCSRCHSTAIEPRVDSFRHHMDSRAAELGISCEACHGPGQQHVTARRAAGKGASSVDAASLGSEILHPEKIDPVRASEICGFCHSMKWIDRNEPWYTHGFRFRPGDRLDATTPLIQPGQEDAVPGLREFLKKNPHTITDHFWSDGMGRVSGREFNGIARSPCFKGGQFSCLSCHSMHESDPDDLLARDKVDQRACTQCHDRFRDPEITQRHTHHGAQSAGSDCYNCHMPHTTYGVLSAIRSHAVSSPRVADELATGRPNACNLCHLNRPLAWTADYLSAWYQQPGPTLSPTQQSVADSVRLALSGDAGQRVLIAWHLGWEPARQTAGSDWIPPLLGVLMDDPYAAVRCVAARSLRAGNPSLEPPGYDYVTEPEDRAPVGPVVWENWRSMNQGKIPEPRIPAAVLVKPDSASTMGDLLEPLLQARDNRPVRLRE